MQHLPVHAVIEFMYDRCNTLTRLQASLANQILNGGPTTASHPAFIHDVIRVQEQQPRCASLVARFEAAGMAANAHPLLEQERKELDLRIAQHLAAIRGESKTLVAYLANESVEVLLELHEQLQRLMDDAREPA